MTLPGLLCIPIKVVEGAVHFDDPPEHVIFVSRYRGLALYMSKYTARELVG